MRIISDFHDYYDAVQAAGQDQSLIYFRKREEIADVELPLPYLPIGYYHSEKWPRANGPILRQHVVGFCGKIYPVLVLRPAGTDETFVCHNILDVDHFAEANFKKKTLADYMLKSNRRHGRFYGWTFERLFRREIVDNLFAECAAKQDAFIEMFREKRSPIFVATMKYISWRRWSSTIVYNASLKELEFYRVIDTYTAFQEIAMFLGNLAAPPKEIPRVPDKIMVGAKGFDEWSFRQPPGKS